MILDIDTVLILQVYSIREAAANNLKRLAEEFGPEWAMQHLVPQVCSNLASSILSNLYPWSIKKKKKIDKES